MMFELIITCESCRYHNNQELETDGFELRQYEFESFTEAFNHQMEYRDHYMNMRIIDTSEQED